MNNTFILFEDRKAEIEFYYSIMLDIENNTGKIQTIDNSKFFRILKSNFMLMLDKLIERMNLKLVGFNDEEIKTFCSY